MLSSFRHVPTIAIYTIVPWAILVFFLTIASDLHRPIFIILHCIVVLGAFGIVFRFYFDSHPTATAFNSAVIAVLAFTTYDAIFLLSYAKDPVRFLNYVDWIFPTFLIAVTVYVVGRRLR